MKPHKVFSPAFGTFYVTPFMHDGWNKTYIAYDPEDVQEWGAFACFGLDELGQFWEPHLSITQDLHLQNYAAHFADMYVAQGGMVE